MTDINLGALVELGLSMLKNGVESILFYALDCKEVWLIFHFKQM